MERVPHKWSAEDPVGWAGSTLEGKYRIESRVGEGGFGLVYRGTDLRLGTAIAIKFLRSDLAIGPEEQRKFFRRFEREAKLLRRLSQATVGVVQAHDVGVATSPSGEATVFIVMEWVEGRTLADELCTRPRRTLVEALKLMAPVLDALAVAHEMGITHRDLKPSNLMLSRDGAGRWAMT